MNKGIKIGLGLLLLSVPALTCDKGCYPYKDVCACDAPTEAISSVKPDNVTAPQTHQNPWEREGVHLLNAPDLRDQDLKEDAQKAAADTEGKKAAGIKE